MKALTGSSEITQMPLSRAQEAEILALLSSRGGLSLREVESKVRPAIVTEVWETLETARRQGYIVPAPAVLPDGSPATETVWLLTESGREFVIDTRSPFSSTARRLAADVGNQVARTWIPIVLLLTIGLALKGKLSGWSGWLLLVEFIVFVPGGWLVNALINRGIRKSVLGESKRSDAW
jgi:hypothetical protein